jgi:hypothetical protein
MPRSASQPMRGAPTSLEILRDKARHPFFGAAILVAGASSEVA